MKKYYYTVGEVCSLLELKPHILRYWEREFPELKFRKKNNRNRRYDPEKIDLLKKIKYMLYEQNYTIVGARKKLRNMNRKDSRIELEFPVEKNVSQMKIKSGIDEIKKILSRNIDHSN